MRSLLFFVMFAWAGCSVASDSAPRDPRSPDPTSAEWRLHIDTRGKGIGAYTLLIQWNQEVAVIDRIEPCSPRYFKGTPMVMDSELKVGRMRVTSFDTSGTGPRSGEWHLFTVIFHRVAPGTLLAKAELQKLYDSENKPLSGRLVDAEFQHTFP